MFPPFTILSYPFLIVLHTSLMCCFSSLAWCSSLKFIFCFLKHINAWHTCRLHWHLWVWFHVISWISLDSIYMCQGHPTPYIGGWFLPTFSRESLQWVIIWTPPNYWIDEFIPFYMGNHGSLAPFAHIGILDKFFWNFSPFSTRGCPYSIPRLVTSNLGFWQLKPNQYYCWWFRFPAITSWGW